MIFLKKCQGNLVFDIESVGALGEDGFYVNVKDESDDSKNHSVILNSANNYDSSAVNPFCYWP